MTTALRPMPMEDLSEIANLAAKAVREDDGIAPDLYQKLPPESVLRMVEHIAALTEALINSDVHIRTLAGSHVETDNITKAVLRCNLVVLQGAE